MAEGSTEQRKRNKKKAFLSEKEGAGEEFGGGYLVTPTSN